MELSHFADLATRLAGELHTDGLMRGIYATDASAYQETPQAVAIPAPPAAAKSTTAPSTPFFIPLKFSATLSFLKNYETPRPRHPHHR